MRPLVCNGSNWNEVNYDILRTLSDPEPMGPRHKPVRHDVVLNNFMNKAEDSGKFKIVNQNGLLSPDNMKFVWAAQISFPGVDNPDYAPAVGFVNYNDQRKAFTGLFGEEVFVCSNEVYQANELYLKRKHMGDILNIVNDKIDIIINKAFDFFTGRQDTLETFKTVDVTDSVLGSVSRNIANNPDVPNRFLTDTLKEFTNPQFDYNTGGGTFFDLLQAGTHASKKSKNPLIKNYQAQVIDSEISRVHKEIAA